MHRAVRSVRQLIVAAGVVLLPLLAPDASAADRRLIVTKNADYSGFDYQTQKGVTLQACQTACIGDQQCRAFTFNEKVGWCFMKTDFGTLGQAAGSTAGRIVEVQAITKTVEQRRLAELKFLPDGFVDEARRLAGGMKDAFKSPAGTSYAAIRDVAGKARAANKPDDAAKAFGQALALADDDPQTWLDFSLSSLDRRPTDGTVRSDALRQATAAAINAYLLTDAVADRARALALVGVSLERRSVWKPAITAYRESLALRDDAAIRLALDKVVAEHGFRITSHEVDADAATPRICLVFSDPLAVSKPGITDFVTVDNAPGVSVEPDDKQMCLEGVKHGGRYHIRVRAGLPSAEGEVLATGAELDVFIRDRAPWVGFAGKAYVLPAGQGASIPLTSINTDKAKAIIYRVGDRSLAEAVRDGVFLGQIDPDTADDLNNSTGEKVFEGTVEIKPILNEQVVTGIPVQDAVAKLKPGVYAITAEVPGANPDEYEAKATQWFVVSDLGLTTLSGNDGVHALVRSLSTAKPVADAAVKLIAVNNELLGEAKTDGEGHAVFAPGLARGQGGMAPQLLVAQSSDGDYSFLDLTKTAFDLTDRGVDGREAPKGLDVYMTTERGVYRPGETVHLTALVRDSRVAAVSDLPLTVVVDRPDGVEQRRQTLSDRGLGGYYFALPMQADAMRGSWSFRVYSDPKGEALAEASVLVEDFEPERLAFDLATKAERFEKDKTADIDISARYLYGATAPDLTIEGDLTVKLLPGLRAYPGYQFGRADDKVEAQREPLEETATTDENGKATLEVSLPSLPTTTRLLQGELILRMLDNDGRAVERKLSLPIMPEGPRIGVKLASDKTDVPEGSSPQFNIIMVSPDGKRVAAPGLNWTVSRVETRYQWYRANGTWKYEPITTTHKVADGKVDVGTGDPATVSAPVEYGRYRLEATNDGPQATSTTMEFYAGWYVAETDVETPEVLGVALDKPAYKVGETAKVRLDARYAGTALVMVVDDRLITMKSVEVPATGTSVDLPVTDAWGPGAYVAAALYRPMDVDAKRMPARALGLTWAKVDPAARKLDVAVDLPVESRPRGPLQVPVDVRGLPAGTEAYVAVAAVDLGILNLTNYKPPAPDDWYFAQRRLGIDVRDLYGQLIDRMAGVPGVVRSGGDEGAVRRLGSPPPTQKLVAFHSGIVKVGADGKATVSFDMPDFNGTVRVMVQAWTKDGVGHAVKDVFVRDPVVVIASLPRFLHVSDQSRLRLDINNVSGAAGTYQLAIDTGNGIAIAAADKQRPLQLAAAARTSLNIPITGALVGDHPIKVTLTMPDGQALPKELLLGVRPAEEPTMRRNLVALSPGGTLRVGADTLAEFVPGTATVTVSVGGASRIDVPGILTALDRYPYGCAEQLTSRALPLVYLNDVARTVGLAADAELRQRVQNAIGGVLAKQSAAGGFGLWGPTGDDDLWLDAYVTDFLTRAQQNGYDLPALSRTMALDNLANKVAYATDFTSGGQDVAYALYVLARNGRAQIGDLRYYVESKLSAFSSPLAKAQLGAALSLYGDKLRSEIAFKAALADIRTPADDRGYRVDYGSTLRDEAAIVTLAAETNQGTIDYRSLVTDISARQQARRYLSTQEQSWMLLAASALIKDATRGSLSVNGQTVEGALYRRFNGEELRPAPVTVINTAATPTDAMVTTIGVPLVPEPAGGQGFKIERAYYKTDGTETDVKTVKQNDRFVVTLTVTADAGMAGRIMVVDPLPAGFEIENPNLSSSGDTTQYDWLEADTEVAHTEARTDRFVAAFNRSASDKVQFTVAYSVRAVSPGVFAHPAATVEDMYRPDRRARTASTKVEVVGPTR